MESVWHTSDIIDGEGEGGTDGVCSSSSSIWIIFVGIFIFCLVFISLICLFDSGNAYWAIFSRLKILLRYSIKFDNALHWFNFRQRI
jgi:uncharacterized membrane protein YbhN (UPF0104 family)